MRHADFYINLEEKVHESNNHIECNQSFVHQEPEDFYFRVHGIKSEIKDSNKYLNDEMIRIKIQEEQDMKWFLK